MKSLQNTYEKMSCMVSWSMNQVTDEMFLVEEPLALTLLFPDLVASHSLAEHPPPWGTAECSCITTNLHDPLRNLRSDTSTNIAVIRHHIFVTFN